MSKRQLIKGENNVQVAGNYYCVKVESLSEAVEELKKQENGVVVVEAGKGVEAGIDMSKLEEFFRIEIHPGDLADELDAIAYNVVYLYGNTPESTLTNEVLSNMVYRLRRLKEVLREATSEAR